MKNTNEEFVSFSTAELAKKVGFDWQVWEFFEGTSLKFSASVKVIWLSTNLPEAQNYNKSDDLFTPAEIHHISRPTQAHLQKWLRSKHIHIHICYLEETKRWNTDMYYIKSETILLNQVLQFSKNRTYEQALERGLLFVLKHLESNGSKSKR